MPASPPSSRGRLLSSGLELASAHGLSAITLSALSERAHLSKSGIFAHFESKEELQLAILDASADLGERHVVTPGQSEPPGLRRLVKVICRWFGWAARAGLPGGCPAAAGMFEYDDKESVVREKLLEMDRQWRGYLAQLAQEAVDAGEFREDSDPEQFVWELCGIYLAHHVSHRFARRPGAEKRAEAALRGLLNRHLADAARLPAISIEEYGELPELHPGQR